MSLPIVSASPSRAECGSPKAVIGKRRLLAGNVSSILLRLAVIDSGCNEPNTTLVIETLTDALGELKRLGLQGRVADNWLLAGTTAVYEGITVIEHALRIQKAPEGWVLITPELERTDQVISRDSLATVVEEAVAWAISRRGRR